MPTKNNASKRLADFIKKAVSPYHTVEESRKLLEEAGYKALQLDGDWKIEQGGKYYVIPFKTSLFAFSIPAGCIAKSSATKSKESTFKKKGSIHIAAAHTDFPCLHIKPVAELEQRGYLRVNTEVYGGPILYTWLDRPLSIAGRVLLKSDDVYVPREVIVDFTLIKQKRHRKLHRRHMQHSITLVTVHDTLIIAQRELEALV